MGLRVYTCRLEAKTLSTVFVSCMTLFRCMRDRAVKVRDVPSGSSVLKRQVEVEFVSSDSCISHPHETSQTLE